MCAPHAWKKESHQLPQARVPHQHLCVVQASALACSAAGQLLCAAALSQGAVRCSIAIPRDHTPGRLELTAGSYGSHDRQPMKESR